MFLFFLFFYWERKGRNFLLNKELDITKWKTYFIAPQFDFSVYQEGGASHFIRHPVWVQVIPYGKPCLSVFLLVIWYFYFLSFLGNLLLTYRLAEIRPFKLVCPFGTSGWLRSCIRIVFFSVFNPLYLYQNQVQAHCVSEKACILIPISSFEMNAFQFCISSCNNGVQFSVSQFFDDFIRLWPYSLFLGRIFWSAEISGGIFEFWISLWKYEF